MGQRSFGQLSRRQQQDLLVDFRKSIWRQNHSHLWSFLCPLCKVERRVPFRSRPGGMHYVQIGLTAAVFTLATWKLFALKGIVSFVPLWALFELIYRARMRAALRCRQCGFDPYLYLVDVPRARQEVEQHWKKKLSEKDAPASSPASMLSPMDESSEPEAEQSP